VAVDRREQLLQIALELIDERGVRGASMRELARRAGVDVRTAYYHFDSKQDLLRTLFEEAGYFTALSELVAPEALETLRSAPAEDAVRRILSWNLKALHDGAAYFRLIHVQVLYGDDDARSIGAEMWQRWGRLLETLVDASGVVPSADAASFARLLRSLVWGVFNEEQLTRELVDPDACRARAHELAQLLTNEGRRQ
jgi:AcrR family transcriptional regulator